MRTSSRILLHLSRLISAVAAVNRVAPPRAWAVGPQGAGGRVQSGRHVETCTGGRQVRVRAVSFGRTYLACRKTSVRFFPPPYKSLASKARRPMCAPAAAPPGTGLAARSASVASHTALFARPQRAVRSRTHPAPAPRCSDCALAHAVSTRGVEQPPHPSLHALPRHAPPRTPHVRASPHSAPSALALTALSPRCTVHPAAHPLQAPVTELTRSHGRALERVAGHRTLAPRAVRAKRARNAHDGDRLPARFGP